MLQLRARDQAEVTDAQAEYESNLSPREKKIVRNSFQRAHCLRIRATGALVRGLWPLSNRPLGVDGELARTCLEGIPCTTENTPFIPSAVIGLYSDSYDDLPEETSDHVAVDVCCDNNNWTRHRCRTAGRS